MNTKSYFEKLEKQYGTLTFDSMLKALRLSDEISQTAFAKKLHLPEMGLIQLAIRDFLKKEGFEYSVRLEEAG